jgi:hypothetical protein
MKSTSCEVTHCAIYSAFCHLLSLKFKLITVNVVSDLKL